MNSYYLHKILESNLPKDYPMDLIKLISKFTCDCPNIKCNFCNDKISKCYLTICVLCKNRTCGRGSCSRYPVDFLVTYSRMHKKLKCCNKCPECLKFEFK